jgi:hypothetical protein
VARLVPQTLPSEVARLVPQTLPSEVERLVPQKLPSEVERLVPQTLPSEVERLLPQTLPSEVERLVPQTLPSEVERLVPQTLPSAASASSAPARNWQLTTAERKRILVAHLYGVDIDAQAVEVTKLSLLLQVLEGEARELRGKQLDFHRVLPDLGHNIKCGNSLIRSDFYAQPNLPAFDDEARLRLNAFDWPPEFKPIMDRGGFDAVIGNPPYIFSHELISVEEREYFRALYLVHKPLVTHVERMLKLHADLAAAKSPGAQTHLPRDIAATDRAIDQLVDQLYGLTPEEIALVEAATTPPAAKSAATDEPSAPVVAPPPPEAYHQAEADAAHHFMAKEDPPPSS